MSNAPSLKKLVEEQNALCYYCDGKMKSSTRFPNAANRPSLERLTPGHDGGEYTEGNVVAACRACNSARPLVTPDEWREIRRALRPSWPVCSWPRQAMRQHLKDAYGYNTGPIIVDQQRFVEMVEDSALMVEMVDTSDLKSADFGHTGSSPVEGTTVT